MPPVLPPAAAPHLHSCRLSSAWHGLRCRPKHQTQRWGARRSRGGPFRYNQWYNTGGAAGAGERRLARVEGGAMEWQRRPAKLDVDASLVSCAAACGNGLGLIRFFTFRAAPFRCVSSVVLAMSFVLATSCKGHRRKAAFYACRQILNGIVCSKELSLK